MTSRRKMTDHEKHDMEHVIKLWRYEPTSWGSFNGDDAILCWNFHLKTELFERAFKAWLVDVKWPRRNFTHVTLMNIPWLTSYLLNFLMFLSECCLFVLLCLRAAWPVINRRMNGWITLPLRLTPDDALATRSFYGRCRLRSLRRAIRNDCRWMLLVRERLISARPV